MLYVVFRLVESYQGFFKKWLLPKTWLNELKNIWSLLNDSQGECVAIEVMKYKSKEGYYGNNPKPRHLRPSNIKYRVGQVFVHNTAGYHGIIIGWDDHARVREWTSCLFKQVWWMP